LVVFALMMAFPVVTVMAVLVVMSPAMGAGRGGYGKDECEGHRDGNGRESSQGISS
jgi:hypothetical protein